jgi:carbon monoxide dehydrogenase subunit G
MPFVTHTASLRAPTDQVWTFVRSFDNWAHFIDGYQAHEVLTETRSTWSIKGTAGSVTRIVTFDVEIIEWVEDDRVEFTLTGTSEPLTGKGEFLTRTTPADPVTTAAPTTVHARDAQSPTRKGPSPGCSTSSGAGCIGKYSRAGRCLTRTTPRPHGPTSQWLFSRWLNSPRRAGRAQT